MPTDTPSHLSWPGEDDQTVVEAMLKDLQSEHWTNCREFVERLVHKQATNIPQETQKDIIQEVMLRVNRSLPYFEHRSTFKTWLSSIVPHCIADEERRRKRQEIHIVPPRDTHNSHEDDEPYDTIALLSSKSTEDESIINEMVREAWQALLEHVATRDHPERDQRIVKMVIYENYSREEAAKVVGCTVAVVGYVLRTAQEYVRIKLGYQLRPKNPRTSKH